MSMGLVEGCLLVLFQRLMIFYYTSPNALTHSARILKNEKIVKPFSTRNSY